MTYPTVFANLTAGNQPASLLDTMFNIGGNQGNIPCTASGTNAITLTPNVNFFLPASYQNYQMVSFAAVATSTGAVTVRIGALAFVNLYNPNGVQSSTNDITIGTVYIAIYNSALNTGAGGFQIISSNAAVSALPNSAPQGRLTLTSLTPVIPTDTTIGAASNMFYTPYAGNLVPVYNGSIWVPTAFSELSLTMNAAHLASNIYDVFVFNNAGTLTLVTGPSWSAGGGSIAAGSCARGTGAGSTQLSRVLGFWQNTVQITGRNGSSTFTVGAGLGTYLGSIFMDTVNGQVTCQTSSGQNRRYGVWNAYQRVPIYLRAADPNATWATTANIGPRASNNDSTNKVTTFIGLPEEAIDSRFIQLVQIASSNANVAASVNISVGFNSTGAVFAQVGTSIDNSVYGAASGSANTLTAELVVTPSQCLGINALQCVEQVSGIGGTTTVTFSSFTGAAMQLTAGYRA